ncbi:MAG: BlaI/MecI/CopY family transcriptional regulator [Verrucomicrobiota bacterium]
MKQAPNIGRGEMDILRFVADHEPVTVRDVADHVARTKGHTRTTALNVMERLRQKGYLTRRKVDGVFHYSPCVPKPDLLRKLVRNFVDSALGGSVSPFVAYLTEEADLDEAELRELRRLVAGLKAKEK